MHKKRVDANQREITLGLRKIGAGVKCLHKVGGGFPDLIVGFRNKNFVFEIKSVKGKTNPMQDDFLNGWPGKVHVVRSLDEAINILLEETNG